MPSQGAIYLDHAGTTPMEPQVLEAMLPYFTQLFGNPSSVHTVGQEARTIPIGKARRVAGPCLAIGAEGVSGASGADPPRFHH